MSDDGIDWRRLSGPPASDIEYVHTGLTGGSTKYYRIRGINGSGNSQWCVTRSARTDSGGPDAPVLTATAAGDNRIDLSWTVPADNGSSIQGYRVERSVTSNVPWERLTSNTRNTAYSDSALYRGMTRYYRVAAFNGAATGPSSAVKSATTTGDPATAPSAPALTRLSNVTRGQVTLGWAVPEDNGGAPVSGYEYNYSVRSECENDPDSICLTHSDVTTTRGTSAQVTGLTTAGLYTYSVRAVDPIGKSGSAITWATLEPATNAAVRVSPTYIEVTEGESFSYTIRLSTEPPHPVLLIAQTRCGDRYLESEVGGRFLIPDGWTHPERDSSSVASERDKGGDHHPHRQRGCQCRGRPNGDRYVGRRGRLRTAVRGRRRQGPMPAGLERVALQ